MRPAGPGGVPLICLHAFRAPPPPSSLQMRPPCGLLGLEAVDSSSSSSLPLSFFLSLPLPLSLSLFLSLSLSFPLSLSLSFSLSLSPSFRFSLPLFLPPPLCLSPSLCPSLSSSLPPPFPAESRRSFTALLPLLLFKTRFRSVSAASAMFRAGSRKPGHTPVIHLAASAMFHATCDCAIWAASRAERNIYIYIYVYVCMHTYIYIYIEREREK